jgi:hypothetical protein
MVKIVNANKYGSLSQEVLNEFEVSIHTQLPSEYRDFLLQHNGGKPIPSFFWIIPHEDGSSVNQFYGLYNEPEYLSIKIFIGKERYGIPESMLPIGDDGVGNYICMGISIENYGHILFLDHELHPFNEPNSPDGITKLKDSFTEFLNSLIDNPD